MVVGDLIGEGSAQEQSVVGETPNLAARLQTLAEPDAVVIAAGTRRLIGDQAQRVAGIRYVDRREPSRMARAIGVAKACNRLGCDLDLAARR